MIQWSTKKVQFRYPLLKDACLLHDNRSQAIAIKVKVEKRLSREGLLETYTRSKDTSIKVSSESLEHRKWKSGLEL